MKTWNNLDILRAFAVLLVAASHLMLYTHHANLIGWMGLSGVSLFFVHTSLVLMMSLERDPHTLRFYIRRIFRLYPLWIVVLAAVVLLHIPISPPAAPSFAYLRPGLKELLANLTLTMNLWAGGARLVGASWSLPVEAQMYLLLPVLFFFIRSTQAVWALLVLEAFVFILVWTAQPWTATVVTLASAIPYFLPGVIAYGLSKRVRPLAPAWTFPVFLCAYAVLQSRFGTLPLSAFFCLAVGLSLPYFREITWAPLARTARLLARYSYGIYLCHIPAICVGVHYLRHQPMPLRIAAMLLTGTAAPVLLYHAVEQPMIRWGARLAAHVEQGPEPPLTPKSLRLEPAP